MGNKLAVEIFTSAALFVGANSAAFADFRICNQTSAQIDAAFAYNDAKFGWTSQGWWNVPGGGCATIIEGKLTSKLYYVYAVNEGGKRWSGPESQRGGVFCISPKKFSIHNRDLSGRTYRGRPRPDRTDTECQG